MKTTATHAPERLSGFVLTVNGPERAIAACGCYLRRSLRDDGTEAAMRFCALHAAGPALLAALEAMTEWFEQLTLPGNKALPGARAAIAQARGEG